MPTETFRHTAHSDAPPATVWEALDEEETWSKLPGADRTLCVTPHCRYVS